MALSIGNGIVQDGLICHLDAANIRSYPGFGTTFYNLVDNSVTSLVNGTTFLTNNLGNFILDGASNYINIPYQLIQSNSSFTISLWVKFITIPSGTYRPVVDAGNFGGGGNGYGIAIDNNSKLYIALNSGFVAITNNLSTNVWYHITGTANYGTPYDLKLYINGTLGSVSSSATTNSLSGINANTKIGSNFISTLFYTNMNFGQIQFYNRALSASEILQNYNSTKQRYIYNQPIINNGLMVGLDFSDPLSYTGIGNTVFDLSVNTYRGTLTNGPKFTNDKNGGIIFDGVDDRIDFSSNLSNIIYNNFSFEFVAKPNAAITASSESTSGIAGASGKRYIIEPTNEGSNGGFGIALGTNAIECIEHGGSYLPVLLSHSANLSDINHYCVVVNDKKSRLYINGVLIKEGLQSPRPFSVIRNIASLGYMYYGNFSGTIYEFNSYSRVLSANEIRSIFEQNRGKYGIKNDRDKSGLILDLDFGNRACYPGTGTSAQDLSGFGITGNTNSGSVFSYDNKGHFSFDGGSQFFTVDSSGVGLTFTNNSDYNISSWIYVNSTQPRSNPSIIEKYNAVGGFPIAIRWFAQQVSSLIFDGSNVASIGATVSTNTWNHISFNHNLSKKILRMFVNGKLVATTDYTTLNNISSNSPTRLGYRGFDSNTYFAGRIADVKIYNKILSPTEINNYYLSTKDRFFTDREDIRDGLILDLDANNYDSYPGGNTWFDTSGSGTTARMVGNNYYIRDRINNSFSLNGSDAYFTSGIVPNIDAYQLPVTYFGWFKMSSISGNQSIFGYFLNTSAIYNYLRMDVGTFRFFLSIDGVLYPGINSGQYQYFDFSTPFVANTWYNFAIVIGGTLIAPTLTFYINNKSQIFSPVNLKSSVTANLDFRIGANQATTQFLNGYVSQFRIYNRTLSASEVNTLFQNTRSRYGI